MIGRPRHHLSGVGSLNVFAAIEVYLARNDVLLPKSTAAAAATTVICRPVSSEWRLCPLRISCLVLKNDVVSATFLLLQQQRIAAEKQVSRNCYQCSANYCIGALRQTAIHRVMWCCALDKLVVS